MLAPTDATREGRMLTAGQLTATVTLPSGEHVTLNFRCKNRTDDGWEPAAYADARFCFVNTERRKRIATIYPQTNEGRWFNATPAAKAAVGAITAVVNGGEAPEGYAIQTADRCGRCGRKLTDPVSINRGIGPECYGKVTGSRHADAGGEDMAARERTGQQRLPEAAAEAEAFPAEDTEEGARELLRRAKAGDRDAQAIVGRSALDAAREREAEADAAQRRRDISHGDMGGRRAQPIADGQPAYERASPAIHAAAQERIAIEQEHAVLTPMDIFSKKQGAYYDALAKAEADARMKDDRALAKEVAAERARYETFKSDLRLHRQRAIERVVVEQFISEARGISAAGKEALRAWCDAYGLK